MAINLIWHIDDEFQCYFNHIIHILCTTTFCTLSVTARSVKVGKGHQVKMSTFSVWVVQGGIQLDFSYRFQSCMIFHHTKSSKVGKGHRVKMSTFSDWAGNSGNQLDLTYRWWISMLFWSYYSIFVRDLKVQHFIAKAAQKWAASSTLSCFI